MQPAPASGLRGVFAALGGWPAVAGLSAAAVTGLWIGVAPPEELSTTAQMVWGEDITLAFEPDLGTDLFPGEGGLEQFEVFRAANMTNLTFVDLVRNECT